LQKVYRINERDYTLPQDFSWKDYIEIYDDLKAAGIVTEKQAIYHYLIYGANESRKFNIDKTKKEDAKLVDKRESPSEKFFDTKNLMYFSQKHLILTEVAVETDYSKFLKF